MLDGPVIPPILAALPEAVITVLVLVGYAIVNLLMKKKQAGDDGTARPGSPPPRTPRRRIPPSAPPPSPPAKTINWEEELRRMLGQEPPRPPPVVLAAPPPSPRPTPRPVVAAPPRAASSDADEQERGLTVPLPSLTDAARAYGRASQLDDAMEARMRQRGAMAEATSSFAQASQLDLRVAEHLRHVTEGVSSFTAVAPKPRRSRSAESAAVAVQTPEGLRTAIIAAIVLGPPKALES
jgi:hypothetical protein